MMRCHFFHQVRGSVVVGAIAITTGLTTSYSPVMAYEGLEHLDRVDRGNVPSVRQISQVSGSDTSATLVLDDSGAAVTELQTQLASLGFFNSPITGYFGPVTQEAVIAFQQSRGLTADGVVGPSTWSALQQTANSNTTNDNLVQIGDAGTPVSTLQNRLSTLGYYQGAIDGVFGVQTESAVIAFQQTQGLYPDGVVGSATQQALSQASIADRPPVGGSPTPAPVQPLPAQPTTPAPVTPAPVQPPIAQLPPPDMEGAYSVLDLQWKLRSHGFYFGPLDGVMGEETQRAISEAQAEYGLTNTDLQF